MSSECSALLLQKCCEPDAPHADCLTHVWDVRTREVLGSLLRYNRSGSDLGEGNDERIGLVSLASNASHSRVYFEDLFGSALNRQVQGNEQIGLSCRPFARIVAFSVQFALDLIDRSN